MLVQALTVDTHTGKTYWQKSHDGMNAALKHMNRYTSRVCHVFFFNIDHCVDPAITGECIPLTEYNVSSWNPSTERLQLHNGRDCEYISKQNKNEKIAETA